MSDAEEDGAGEGTDITALILDDHDTFRRGFAALDEALAPDTDPEHRDAKLAEIWAPLADLLDLHAVAEEQIFYPMLLRKGDEGEAVDETIDAVGDHNDIRDAVREAAAHPAGSEEWWKAVERARAENTHHMAEEEDEALPDLRRTTTRTQRIELGRQFSAAMAELRDRPPAGNTDPREFLARHRQRGARAVENYP